MRALVVYESIFGNTERIATAVASGLAEGLDVCLAEASDAPDRLDDVDLVLVGGPTHAFSMSRGDSRKNAAKKADDEPISLTAGIRDWLKRVDRNGRPIAAVAFDTRFKMSRKLTGSAARAAEKRLRKRGFEVTVPAESFFIEGERGPLHAGEADRAHRWAASLSNHLVATG